VKFPETLVLGLGNDILTDDAIGLRVAAALRERLAGQQGITVTQTAEMGLALLDLVVGFDRLVIIDAIQTKNAAPGFVHEFDAEHLPALPAISPHFLGIGETLALGKELGLSVPTFATIFAVEVEDPFTVGTSLTPRLEASLSGIVEKVARAMLR
jgi:hydrogenase maturation protease